VEAVEYGSALPDAGDSAFPELKPGGMDLKKYFLK
jgi:hypothetical protein